MRRLLIFAFCIFACVAAKANQSYNPAALRAIITADFTEVHPDSVFEVTLSLENVSGSPQVIKIPDCGWDRDWKSSSHRVSWDAWDCDETSQVTITIEPRETYVFPKTLKMFVDEAQKETHLDFRMGFKTAAFGKTVWSNPITLDVIP